MIVIKIVDLAGLQISGQPTPFGYITGCDVDAVNGLGRVDMTTEKNDALRFASLYEAVDYWRQPSKVLPLRPDGMPNRPLTAYTVEFETIEEE